MKLKLFSAVLVIALVAHFGILGLYHMPNNPIKHQYKHQVNSYVHPFFSQEWKLFSPNPANSNMTLHYRFDVYQDGVISNTNKWLNVNEPIIEFRDSHLFSPGQRLLKYFSTCMQDIIETNGKALKIAATVDTISTDSLKVDRFIRSAVEASMGHNGVMEYSKFVLHNYLQEENIVGYDSIILKYKVSDEVFPRFSKRKEDYFAEENYEYKELISQNYTIKNVEL